MLEAASSADEKLSSAKSSRFCWGRSLGNDNTGRAVRPIFLHKAPSGPQPQVNTAGVLLLLLLIALIVKAAA